MTIAELESSGAILGIQDGNHGEKHPVAADYVATGVPFIMASDIADDGINFDICKFLAKRHADSLRVGFARPGDVLLTHKGTVGRSTVVPAVDGYIMLTPQVTYYRVDPKLLDATYLAYAFRTPEFQAQLASISAQSTRPYVSLSTQRALQVVVWPIDKQRRLGSTLSAYDQLLKNNTRRIQILEEMARVIYDEHCVRLSGSRYLPLGELVDDPRDTVNPTQIEYDTPYIGLEHLPRRSFTLRDWGTASEVESTKLRFAKGDILFGKIRPYFHKVVAAPLGGVCSSDAIVWRPKDPSIFALVLSTVSSDEFVRAATQTSNGTKMPRANPGVLAKYPVPMPGAPALDRFREAVDPLIV